MLSRSPFQLSTFQLFPHDPDHPPSAPLTTSTRRNRRRLHRLRRLFAPQRPSLPSRRGADRPFPGDAPPSLRPIQLARPRGRVRGTPRRRHPGRRGWHHPRHRHRLPLPLRTAPGSGISTRGSRHSRIPLLAQARRRPAPPFRFRHPNLPAHRAGLLPEAPRHWPPHRRRTSPPASPRGHAGLLDWPLCGGGAQQNLRLASARTCRLG